MSEPIEVESWIWYGFVTLVVGVRFISRYTHLKSFKRLQLEDYLMVLAICLYTILIVLLNYVAEVQTNLIAPEDLPNLNPENIAARVRGSKMVLALETCMCCVIWLCKSCILLLYYKLTFGLAQNIIVKVTGAYVVFSFVVMMILYFAVWCRPFSGYWETPSSNVQCTTATNHLITNFTFNLTSDLLILSVPLPLLLRSSLPLRKKAALTLLFSVGLFAMVCAILSKYYSFRQPFSPMWIYWYTREASTAMIVTNVTHVWAIFRRVFHLRSFIGESARSETETGTSSDGAARQGLPVVNGSVIEDRQRQGMVEPRTGIFIPFADTGGLLSPPRSSNIESKSHSSYNQRNQVANGACQPPTRSFANDNFSVSSTKQHHQHVEESRSATSPSPPPIPTALVDMQTLRNPAASADESRHARALKRVDSITRLGLPAA